MIDKSVHFSEFPGGVILQQMAVVTSHFHQTDHMVIQFRWFEPAERLFTQVENRQTRCQILVIGGIGRNQVRRRPDNGFMDIRRTDPIIKLDMGT